MKMAFLYAFCVSAALTHAAPEPGFTSLFDGKTLNGWTQMDKRGEGYGVKEGVIFCAKGGGGRLFTEKEYSDFVFRFDFKLEDGSNNGLGIRSPLEGDPAYVAIELQILDDESKRYGGKLRPAQYHGSIYDVVPAERGALKKAGEWNEQEVTCIGRKIKVVLNGKTILDADVNKVTDPEKIMKHPGLFRDRGHIGFLGHNDYLEFRNIRIKELPLSDKDNVAPAGFTALFNGKDLTNWKGLLAGPNDNPAKRAKLSPEELQKRQAEADDNMGKHWKVADGALEFDGKGRSLATAKNYANFEMLVDWKIPPKGDSGIYLRGTPQVQIWDPTDTSNKRNKLGSGGLFNNQKNPADPVKLGDKPVGEWNRFRIIMIGEKVHVFLNGVLVVENTTLENYWERDKPIYPAEQIELQNHNNPLHFKNIYIREL
jgi:3-keto-disaccharide hydrolase